MNIFGPHGTDGYKLGHGLQDPQGITLKYSNLTPRSDRLFKAIQGFDHKVVVFGVQGGWQEIVEIWDKSFFNQPKDKAIARYKRRVDNYLGPDVIPVDKMERLHDLGYLPLSLRTIDEGARIGMKVPVLTLESTNADFSWLTNYLETIVSNTLWKSMTNATIAYEYKRLLTKYAKLTGSDLDLVQFQAHDFSARGMSGPEDAARSGAAHMAAGHSGTDTVSAIDYLEDYYGADSDKELVGVSVPATEHAVSSSNILVRQRGILADPELDETEESSRVLAETMFLYDLITKTHPTGIVSYVADTYDYWKVLTEILPSYMVKQAVMKREGKLVIRPDSGDPVKIICGMLPVHDEHGKAIDFAHEEAAYEWLETGERTRQMKDCDCIKIGGTFYGFEASVYDDYTEGCGIDTDIVYPYHVVAGSIRTLWKTFGGTITETGHKLLDSHIGLIYGDSITLERAEKILQRLAEAGFASGNVVFGVGSYTYQMNSRDTFGTAMKATYVEINGEGIEIYKDPATGDKLKKSAKGLLRVVLEDGEYVLYDQQTKEQAYGEDNELKERWRDGKWITRTTLQEVRARLLIL